MSDKRAIEQREWLVDPMTLPEKPRARIYRFSSVFLHRLFTHGSRGCIHVQNGIPEGSRIISVEWSLMGRWWDVLVEHESFDEVDWHAEPPLAQPIIERFICSDCQCCERESVSSDPTVEERT